jgi:hypothetical protein
MSDKLNIGIIIGSTREARASARRRPSGCTASPASAAAAV